MLKRNESLFIEISTFRINDSEREKENIYNCGINATNKYKFIIQIFQLPRSKDQIGYCPKRMKLMSRFRVVYWLDSAGLG